MFIQNYLERGKMKENMITTVLKGELEKIEEVRYSIQLNSANTKKTQWIVYGPGI